MGIREFQEDLREGMSLEQALKTHNLTFQQALERCPKPTNFDKRKPTKKHKKTIRRAGKYIQQRGKRFYLRKNVKGKMLGFGSYETLNDAEKVRDFLMDNGWNEIKVREACKKYRINVRMKTRNRG